MSELFETNESSAQVEQWKKQLECTRDLKFPFDFPRKNQSSGQRGIVPVEVSNQYEYLQNYAEQHNLSVEKFLLTIYAILLNRYSGDNEICIGISSRSLPTENNPVDPFILCLSFSETGTIIELFNQVNDYCNRVVNKQIVLVNKIVKTIQTSSSQFFPATFSYTDNERCNQSLQNNSVSLVGDISINFKAIDKKLFAEINYNTEILAEETIQKFANHFCSLLNNIKKSYSVPYSKISLLSDEETLIIKGFTDTTSSYPSDKSIIELFEEQVKLYPNKIAVSFKENSLSYKELNEKSNRLSQILIQKGVKPDMPVGLMAEKSVEMIVGILAILKAGGAYLPLDPEYPKARIQFIIDDAQCQIVLVQAQYMDTMDVQTTINLNDPQNYQDPSNERISSNPDNLAYIMYTSGTTGKPKGTLIQQKGVVRLVRNTNYIDLTQNDRILLTGAIVFDATTLEIWGALLNGGSLYIVDKQVLLDPDSLCNDLIKNKITTLWLTSALFTFMAEKKPEMFRNLKYLLAGGDVLSSAYVNKVDTLIRN